jgi:uncharacterized small protein (DUF1192 family)
MIPLKINYPDQYPRPTLIEQIVRLGLPLLSADEANERIIALEVEVMRLQAKLDARGIQ